MPRVYLDHAATTPVAPEVFEVMKPHFRAQYGNASSVHELGREARVAVEEARDRVAACLGADSSEIVFTSGGTEANNLALKGVLRERSRDARTAGLVTSAAEHKAILRPSERLEKQGHPVTMLSPERYGAVTAQQVESALDGRTALVSIMHTNNETGIQTDIAEIAKICDEHEVLFHCDAVQAAGYHDLDVNEMGVDLLSISAHKFHGPKGVGVLFVRGGVDIHPLIEGGAQERKRRGGTENVPGVVGLAEALERSVDRADVHRKHLEDLQEHLLAGIDEVVVEDYVLSTPVQEASVAPHVVNVAFPPVNGEPLDGEMLILNLDMNGVCVSAGSACQSGALEPSHVLSALGLNRETASAAVRFSVGIDNTTDEIDFALDTLGSTLERMRGRS